MRRLPIGISALALLLALVPLPVVADDGASLLAQAEMEIQQAQGMLTDLREDVEKLRAEGYSFVPEERFIDAMVYFDLQHFDQSALLFTSLIEDKRFKRDKKYFEAVKLLGIAHYNERNYQAAFKQFQSLRAAGVEVELATTYLVEIAAHLGRLEALHTLASGISLQSSAGLLYARGKALYFTGEFDGAVASLRGVSQGLQGLKAQYITGASLVALGRMEDAQRVFETIAKTDSASDEEAGLRELSYLALGRIAYEVSDFSKAADYYQQISRKSPYFEQALYEVTHVHIRWSQQKDTPEAKLLAYGKAEEILDVLVSITKDPELSRDARILRGRINMFLEKYEQAEEAYQEVIEMFAATSSEMTDVSQDPKNIDRFFQAMIRGGEASSELSLFVSEEVVMWMKSLPSLGRVVEMLSDVAAQRAALGDAQDIYQQLEFSLAQDSARELFPGFSDTWLKSLEIENRLLFADSLLLEAEGEIVGRKLTETDKLRLEQLHKSRGSLEKKLSSAPRTVVAYKIRSKDLMTAVGNLVKEADERILRLAEVRGQVLAMQKLLNEVKYKGSRLLEVKDEDRMTREIAAEGGKINALMKEAEALRAGLEKEMLAAEVGDPRAQSESNVKSHLWQQHRAEATFYIDQAQSMDEKTRKSVDRANGLRRTIIGHLAVVRDRQVEIDKKAAVQIRLFKKVLKAEAALLKARDKELAATEKAALAFAHNVGKALFLEAKEQLVKAVIEADLGLVDLTWRRKQEETRKIDAIQKERSQVVRKLRAELQAVAGEEEGQE